MFFNIISIKNYIKKIFQIIFKNIIWKIAYTFYDLQCACLRNYFNFLKLF